jgi:site-specific DNA recombinase
MAHNYFLYARKSTEDDDRQVMSIEAQLFELREYARRENLEILAEFIESKSAKSPGREVFNDMMTRLESGEANGILAWHPDRLARNSMDGGRVIYAVDTQKIVSLRFPQFWFEPTPQGLFMLQVAFGQSKYYSDNLSENIKRGVRQKLRRGEWLTLAPFGYQNNPRTHNIEPHPTYGKVIARAFEEYAKGSHTLVSLGAFLAELGVVSKNGTPLAKISIKRLLTNRAYLGFLKHKGEWFTGNFEPLISPAQFEAVQKIVVSKERPRKRKQKHDFPFTGLFRCAECGSMISAQWTTNRHGTKYRYYRCSKKKNACSQPYIQEMELADKIRSRLETIALADKYTGWMLNKMDEWEKSETAANASSSQNLSSKIKASEERMEKLVSAYLDGDIPKESYLKRKDETMRSIASLQAEKKDFDAGKKKWVEPTRQWILDTKQANFLANADDLRQIKAFVQKVGTNPEISGKSPFFGFPPPYEYTARMRGKMRLRLKGASANSALKKWEVKICGEGGIRTHGTVSHTPHFECGAFDHSATSPYGPS